MPTEKIAGYRTTIMLSPEVEKKIQKFRKYYSKLNGFKVSRSAVTIMALETFLADPARADAEFRKRNGLPALKGAVNGQ